MPKTPDEIKKGLECCAASYADCHRECPYKPDCDGTQILKDAIAYIQQLEAQNAEKDARIQQLEKRVIHLEALNQSDLSVITMQERTRGRLQEQISQLEAELDAAVKSLRGRCFECKHNKTSVCLICSKDKELKYWQWRGVQKEE